MKPTERVDRLVLFVIGSVLASGAAAGLAAGFGAFGSATRDRLVTSSTTTWVRGQDGRLWWAVAAVAVVVGLLAVAWLVHQLRRVHSPSELDLPDLELGRLTLPSAAVADALHQDLLTHQAIEDASVHVLSASPPTIDAVIDIHERADLEDVKRHVDAVLGRFESALGDAPSGRCTFRLVETPRVAA